MRSVIVQADYAFTAWLRCVFFLGFFPKKVMPYRFQYMGGGHNNFRCYRRN